MTASVWGREDMPDEAAARLLEAAGTVFATKGVVAVTVADVATAAGCARGTVYRYFGDRDGLRRAFVNREAGRVGARVLERVQGLDDPAELLVASVLAAVDEVRTDPVLAVWFTETAATTSARIAVGADAVRALTEGWVRQVLADADGRGRLRTGVDIAVAADAVVRLILSLLMVPVAARSRRAATAAERRLVECLLTPAFFTETDPNAHDANPGATGQGSAPSILQASLLGA